jgi:hypothetical protein
VVEALQDPELWRHINGRCDTPDVDLSWIAPILIEHIAALSQQPDERDGDGLKDIAAERARQIDDEGWSPEHDDGHSNGELGFAAAAYAMFVPDIPATSILAADTFRMTRWDMSWWKPGYGTDESHRRNLVKAGALVVAEIERLDRAQLKGSQ